MQRREIKNRKSFLLLKDLCQFVKNGRFNEALEQIMEFIGPEKAGDLENEPLYQSTLFWKGTMNAAAALEPYTSSEFLTTQWNEFAGTDYSQPLPESFRYALKEYVYNAALSGYLELYKLSGITDTIVLTRIGALRKGLGDYELAIQSFEQARSRAMEDAGITAALADCYALIDEPRAAKLLFREAFFLDPEAVDYRQCEAPFIKRIAADLLARDIPHEDVCFWIPVMATVEDVFNVRRELKPVEIGRLTQSIRELERRHAEQPSSRTRALLLNRYFWLADHCRTSKAPREDLDEVLKRIQQLDPEIYERYLH
jgi:tetratricopeptide (TPR) repeat protein